MKIEYLLFNLIIFLPVLLIKIIFYRKFLNYEKKIWQSIFMVAFIFILKDIFSNNYFWRFNNQYILGIKFFGLPIEELMFFFTVSYAMMFVYLLISIFFNDQKVVIKNSIILLFIGLLISLSLLAFIFGRIYFFYITLFFTLTFVFIKSYFSYNTFRFYFVIFVLTLIFNFYLTARPVVIYNPDFLIGIKILTIPIEDFIYSFSLFSLLLYFFLRQFNKKIKKT